MKKLLVTIAAFAPVALLAATPARAADPLGFYIGAEYGQAHIRARIPASLGTDSLYSVDVTSPGVADFTHSAYQVMAGVRPLEFLGAEVTYVDFGSGGFRATGYAPGPLLPFPTGSVSGGRASQKGEAAFAVLYLPVPVIDLYLKAGVARMTTDLSIGYQIPGVGTCMISDPQCATAYAALQRTDTGFAGGVGLQWGIGSWAIRAEYERFDVAGASPSLAAIGLTWTIP